MLAAAAWGLAAGRPAFETHLPRPLLEEGPRGLLWWQWLGIPLVVLAAAGAGVLLGFVSRKLLEQIFTRAKTAWDELLLTRLRGPLTLLWSLAAAYVLVPWLALSADAESAIGRALHAGSYVVFFWTGLRTIEVGFQFIAASPWARGHPSGVSLLPLGRKLAKIVVVAMGAIAVLTELGYPVASLLAGLGIGGLALALAAQKTVENLFGSVAISVDQPFRIGDFVRIEGFSGTVEAVGLRSTRIRTLDRTVISIPNGKLADMRIETFAPRDRIRLAATLPVVHATTAAQMRVVLSGIEGVLRAQPKLHPEGVMVRFAALSPSSLDVEVNAWFATTDWNEFVLIREAVLLGFLEAVEHAGTALAYPTQTIHLEPGRTDGKKEARSGRPGL